MRGKSTRTVVGAVGLAALTAVAVACSSQAAQEAAGPRRDTGTAPPADANILVVGMHSGPGRDGARPDTLVLVHVPKSGDSAAIVSLPRDLYVDGGKAIGQTKLNSVYAQALAVERRAAPQLGQLQVAQKAQQDLVAVVQRLTGVRIDHYAQVDMPGFAELTEVVGGVEVCLNHATRDARAGADFRAGVQTVKGATALAFVRQRMGLPDGDLDRVKRQQAFLAGLVDAVVGRGVLTDPAKRNALIAAVRKHVVLDQRWDLVSFANQVRSLTATGVRTTTLPVRSEQRAGGMAVLIPQTDAAQFVRDFIKTQAPGHSTVTLAKPPTRGGDSSARCVD